MTPDHPSSGPGFAWDVASPFIQVVEIGPQHLDGFGHTNNVVYLGLLQDVAWAHSVSLGLGMDDYRRLGAGCVVRRHELDYLAATFQGDLLHCATWVHSNDGRLDMWRAFQIIREQDRRTILRGLSQWVCVDMKSGRPRRQPPAFLEAYRPVGAD